MSLLTRVAPSRLVPAAKGVFITHSLKKFTPVEIDPPPDAIAPPYLVNLLRTPPHTISLRRFLALRHQFSSGTYFNVATPGGWYLIVPHTHAPLADRVGLQVWREKHHHRYEQKTTERSRRKNETVSLMHDSATTHEGIPPLGTHDGDERASATAVQERLYQDGDDDNNMENEAEDEGVGFHAAAASLSGSRNAVTRASRLGASRVSIPEEHLFEINDGVLWETPPQDDLGCPAYWKQHRVRMQLYEDTSVSAAQGDFWPPPSSEGLNEAPGYMERERYVQQQRILQTLTRKANVKLNVDDDQRLLTLVPIIDLKEGDELLLHYGREWWSQRLLSTLFMSVPDSKMRDVRWIEALFTKSTDVSRPFPQLCSAVARRKLPKQRKIGKTAQDSELVNAESTVDAAARQDALVLYNVVTRRKATDAEALIYAVRRSCVDRSFFSSLVGVAGSGVFDASHCDDEVPLRQLRRALLQSLRQESVSEGKTSTPEAGCDDDEGDGSLSF
ncbi:hypothetical protein TraAM80_01918 [Trypanosoma rangeli]|uniref:SET domain-containing protein n=1 Tax=Trypanosoma rangeli TaxID=5698 RepID=A0A3S5IS33_TRYRA|nr:uncharacterized protein TraAM80_01918 [Trypanosoma rangeli]RNF09784.1 hypothetical protein TraAM80_01918 [Trypanosoma rangeli]|eukprot:RNF09784.1 hypothetical protein TraAM80_01918 [Trypanosoma rangeli]